MSMLRNWVLHNGLLKLVALMSSFLLWAAYTSLPLAEATYVVPLVFQNIPAGLDLSGDEPAQVHVVLRGRAERLRRIGSADVTVSVDLAGRSAGESQVSLTARQVETPLGAQLARIAPAQMRVRLEPRAVR